MNMVPWILLRGLVRERRHWGPFLTEFAEANADTQVVALDLPGNGLLYLQQSPSSVRGMVEAYRVQLAAMGLHAPYRILAVSMGAMVAAEWSHRYPDEVAAQVLINTSMRPFSPFYQRLRPHNYLTLLRLIAAPPNPWQRERAVLHMTTHELHADVLPYWHWLHLQCPVSRSNALRQLWAAARYRANLHRPAAPTLVLASAQDALVTASCSYALAAAWAAPMAVHPTAGHDLALDDGPWVTARVRDWLVQAPDTPLSRG